MILNGIHIKQKVIQVSTEEDVFKAKLELREKHGKIHILRIYVTRHLDNPEP